ncbi:hypothetical protein AOLI_G00099790 [Acnodon oligacanthus]
MDMKSQASSRDELQPYTGMHSPVTSGTAGYDFVPLQKPQRDQRVHSLTEKGQELHDEQVKRIANRFSVCYKKWKEVAKKANQTLSGQCSTDLLNEHVTKVNDALRSLNAVYEELRRISVPDDDTRRRLDTCETVTQRIVKQAMDILDTKNGQSQGHEERGDAETRSTKTSFSSRSAKASTHSRLTSVSRKSAAAEVAASEATLQVLLEQERHIEELQKLEAEAAQLKAKQESKRRELERLETIKKLKAAKARQQVQSEVKQEVSPLQHHSPPQAVTHPAEDNAAALVRALAESISASRIPVPEPTMFNGDPLRYNDWKVSFQTLIDRKNIPAEEKIYYLRKYVGGSAKKAIDSYFLLGTELAYLAAWCILEERYGSPFLIAKAFRDKIDAWPKISAKGSLELQEFVDFLRSCHRSGGRYNKDYKTFMQETITHGDAERVPHEDIHKTPAWYIPHHGVYHPQKPGKMRVVFDCSAKFQGTSLNDHLLTGPELTNTLVGVLVHFRRGQVAVMCDIERMFHQFHVKTEDQDYLRFLWWENGNLEVQPSIYRMKVHLFGAASSPGCANYGLKHISAERQGRFSDYTIKFIQRNFYVDDGLASVASTSQAIQLVKEARELCSTGKLRLHKFISNSKEVLATIPKEECAQPATDKDMALGELQMERALGLHWCVASDDFQFRVVIKENPLTHRGVLSTVASIYDPLGFVAPFVPVGKQILQQMCRDKLSWDATLPDDL